MLKYIITIKKKGKLKTMVHIKTKKKTKNKYTHENKVNKPNTKNSIKY